VKAANKDKKMNSSTTPHNLNNRYRSALQDDGLPAFNQTGALGIFQLKRIWQKSRLSRVQKLDASIAEKEWLLAR
jgi:hypothetical protein